MPKKAPKHHYRAVFFPDEHGIDGQPDEQGKGVGYTKARHKRTWEYSPFCISNEFICGKIGSFLGLPVPPLTVTYSKTMGYFFSSLDFNFDEEDLPAIQPNACFECLPELCAGIVAFDILIANEDRHDKNLSTDDVRKPKHMKVFDHDQALFGGGGKHAGVERLNKLTSKLGVTGSDGVTGSNRHILLDVINSKQLIEPWLDKISDIPSWFIDDSCKEVIGYEIDSKQAQAAIEFLKVRRDRIGQIVDEHRDEFEGISNWDKERLL